MSLFSENLRSARELAGLTQKDMSERIHTSEAAYGLYEQGKREPKIEMLCTLSQTLNVSIDDLVGNPFKCPSPIDRCKGFCEGIGFEVEIGNGVAVKYHDPMVASQPNRGGIVFHSIEAFCLFVGTVLDRAESKNRMYQAVALFEAFQAAGLFTNLDMNAPIREEE